MTTARFETGMHYYVENYSDNAEFYPDRKRSFRRITVAARTAKTITLANGRRLKIHVTEEGDGYADSKGADIEYVYVNSICSYWANCDDGPPGPSGFVHPDDEQPWPAN